jgi:hypothetical protein
VGKNIKHSDEQNQCNVCIVYYKMYLKVSKGIMSNSVKQFCVFEKATLISRSISLNEAHEINTCISSYSIRNECAIVK